MFGLFKNYIQDKITLVKIEMLDSLSQKGGEFGYLFLLLGVVFLFIVFTNFAALFYLASWIGSFGLTFLVFAGFYGLLALVIYFFRHSIMNFIQNKIIHFASEILFRNQPIDSTENTNDS